MEIFETITYEQKGAIAIITMNRPDKLNACSTFMYKDIDKALDIIEESDEIRAVIITGSGDQAFSAGADLQELNFENLKQSRKYIDIDAKTFRHLENIPQPVIAAVNGSAIGYGCKIAIISDITIASEKAKFCLPGTSFGAVHVIMLGRALNVLGRKRLANMLLTGEMIDVHQAERYGIVNTIVPQDQLLATAEKVANKIASFPPISVQVTRRMLHRGNDDDYRWEDLLSPGLLLMEDVKEGQRAFIEKRKPKFTGK
ncbi:enoyl-CoA hydratase/isomerase family protein [uncultured Desulfosarcina sp.]|uniref:enoyl-CoA hydratase/isomerase family protein n=1 Tax=uncultured Desulfosarcina sp. TaxID=218289 RepID=UPI0029C6FC90|nr:enoyl-CoA hydratase/isomerase family protein [uncultured Desulfosarcina sp.]